MKQIAILCLLCPLAPAQVAVRFEAASIKTAAPVDSRDIALGPVGGCSGGPGTARPGQYVCRFVPMDSMIVQAFGLQGYQYQPSATPSSPRFDVIAKIPTGATQEQVRTMLQNLLKERFGLASHFEKREMEEYRLSVAKGGPKLKAADPHAVSPTSAGKGSALSPPPGHAFSMVGSGHGRLSASAVSLDKLVSFLIHLLNRPVIDATGLQGDFDFSLVFATDNMANPGDADASGFTVPDTEGAPEIPAALQQQLGLKLEREKGLVDFLIIDAVANHPTGN